MLIANEISLTVALPRCGSQFKSIYQVIDVEWVIVYPAVAKHREASRIHSLKQHKKPRRVARPVDGGWAQRQDLQFAFNELRYNLFCFVLRVLIVIFRSNGSIFI